MPSTSFRLGTWIKTRYTKKNCIVGVFKAHIFAIDKIQIWAICYRYLVYTLEESAGSDAEYLYIVDLENENHTLKVHNFGVSSDGITYLI